MGERECTLFIAFILLSPLLCTRQSESLNKWGDAELGCGKTGALPVDEFPVAVRIK